MLRVLDLFSGLGGISIGLERTEGFGTSAFCEINPYCRTVLKRHWPDVPAYADIRDLTADTLCRDGITEIDVICGGFPCQDISLNGKGLGLQGERSGLWSHYARLIRELRPRYIIVENVAALLGRGGADVLGFLASCGYNAEWRVVPAWLFGLPHNRGRVWIVAYLREERAQGSGPFAFSWVAALPWRQNVRRAQDWASRPDLPASGLCRNRNGVPSNVDRVGALGNSIIPDIPERIGRAILASLWESNEERAAGAMRPYTTVGRCLTHITTRLHDAALIDTSRQETPGTRLLPLACDCSAPDRRCR